MPLTLEELRRISEECGARKMLVGFNREYIATCFEQEELQAFAQHWIEVGRKEQREKDAMICHNKGLVTGNGIADICAEAIRNNTGE